MQETLILEAIGRLPGPHACQHLRKHGFSVAKIENKDKRDPFSIEKNIPLTNLFNSWYKNFLVGKQHFIIDGKSKCVESKILPLLKKYKKFIILSAKFNCPLENEIFFIKTSLTKMSKKFSHILVGSDSKNTPIHDLDMSAKFGIINQKSPTPLGIPIMGVLFSTKIINAILMAPLKNDEITLFFKDEVEQVLDFLNEDFMNSPIAGKILSYNSYSLKNGMIVLTALEKRSWNNFVGVLNLPFSSDDRFESVISEKGLILSKSLLRFTYEQLSSLFQERKLRCFTKIK